MVMNKVTQAGSNVVSADYESVYEAIDLRLKEMHRLGIFWRKVDYLPHVFTVTAAVNSASASVEILFPISLHIRDGSADEPVHLISRTEYAAIEDKSETGLPNKALWLGSATFVWHPVPTATTTARLMFERVTDDSSSGAAFDIDVSMIRWMRDIAAYDIGDYFGIPENKMQRWERESMRAERYIRALNAPRGVSYAPVQVDSHHRSGSRTETDYGR